MSKSGNARATPKLISPDDLAAILGVTRKSIYNRVNRGQIPPEAIVHLGDTPRSALRFDADRINDWLTKKRGSQREQSL